MMSRNRMLVSLVAIPLLVLLVACGGDKKESSSSNDGGGSSPSNSSSSSSGGGSTGGSVSSNDGASSLENCKQYQQLDAAATAAFSSAFSSLKVDEKALNDLVKASPSEIRNDMTLVVGSIIEFFQGVEKLGINFNDPAALARMDAAKLAEFEKLGEKFDDAKFTAAAERIEKYYVSKCS
jgi:hypothetical protein